MTCRWCGEISDGEYCATCGPVMARKVAGARQPRQPHQIPDEYYDQAARWVAGETLEAIAADEGVTRERVRQRIAQLLPRRTVTAIKQARMAEQPRRQVARYKTCAVCGVEYRSSGKGARDPRWPLCPAHQSIRSAVMMMCDDDRHEKHNLIVAKMNGREVPTYTAPIWQTRKALGHDRHLVAGSQMHQLVLEAREHSWPLWDRLPEQIREWVRNSGTPLPEWTCVGCSGTFQRAKPGRFCSRACYLSNQTKRAAS